jgi:hypothetical protein
MKRNTLILLILFVCSAKLSAWSKQGHHIIAQIAKSYMSQPLIDSVQKYLGAMSFEDASTWMDDVRKTPGMAYLKTWHYVNIEKDASYVATDTPNLINQLQLAIKNLQSKNRNAETINFNLKILFHLLGDLHQPLHIGYVSDRGGNDTEVKYFKRTENLHHVWDDLIIQSENISTQSCLALAKTLPLSIKSNQAINDIIPWANESRLLLTNVYNITDNYIAHAYINRNVPIIEIQLLKAGMRLAEVLNAVFYK